MAEALTKIMVVVVCLVAMFTLIKPFLYLVLATGWIYIFAWLRIGAPLNDPQLEFVLIPLFAYLIVGIVWVMKPDPDGLPRGLKFLAFIIPASLQRRDDGQIDLPDLAARSKDRVLYPFTNLEKKFHAYRHRRAEEDLRVDTEYHDAHADLHRTAQEYNRAKLRAEEAERARKRHGKR